MDDFIRIGEGRLLSTIMELVVLCSTDDLDASKTQTAANAHNSAVS